MTCSLGSVSNCGPARFSEDFLPLRASNTCAWATLLTPLPDLDDGVLAAGHAAPDPELVVLRVHGDDLEVPDRDGLVAHLARHLLSLEDARRVGGRAYGSGLPDVVRAVGDGSAPEAVALHGALKPRPLLVALTCTLSPTSKTSAPMASPTSPVTPRSSLRCRRGGASSLAKVPAWGLFTLLDFTLPKPTCTAS